MLGEHGKGRSERLPDNDRPVDYVQSLDRGLAVIRAFTPRHPSMTVTEVAERAQMNRAAARRFLLTLEYLGYVRSDGRKFSLQPRVLELGYAYLSSVHPWDSASPLMESLSTELEENVLAGVLEGAEVVCVARTSRRLVTVAVYVGGRVPALASSMGRAIIAYLPENEAEQVLERAEVRTRHSREPIDIEAARQDLADIRRRGWSVMEGELEEGLLSISAPVFGPQNRIVAALNVSAHGNRLSREDADLRIAPQLLDCAKEVSRLFQAR
ncbi:IclR family transcriptional regulator C-terminal domain-containing protein [Saccharomonospora sp. NPDC046836]|uniref:IclR family transcriptional regulator domain-containing protein n=1 Tax=Saccharomonospora sp. NPDC046836 TaxID=3156921 RepID=UPI0033D6428C